MITPMSWVHSGLVGLAPYRAFGWFSDPKVHGFLALSAHCATYPPVY